MWKSWSEVQSFFTANWGVATAISILVLVLGWKMSAQSANILLVAAWVILVISIYQTSFVYSQPLVPRVLLVMGCASLCGLAIYSTLWTNILKTHLVIVATTSSADRAPGSNVGGILWLSKYAGLKVVVINDSELDYQSVDLVIVPDVAVTATAQLTNIQGVSIWRYKDLPAKTLEMADFSGNKTNMPYVPIASDRGYRVRCELLPANSHIELIMAAVSMIDTPTFDPVDKHVKMDFADGHSIWLAHPDHTENIFKIKPVPRLVKVTGHYKAQNSEYQVSNDIVVVDPMGQVMESTPKY